MDSPIPFLWIHKNAELLRRPRAKDLAESIKIQQHVQRRVRWRKRQKEPGLYNTASPARLPQVEQVRDLQARQTLSNEGSIENVVTIQIQDMSLRMVMSTGCRTSECRNLSLVCFNSAIRDTIHIPLNYHLTSRLLISHLSATNTTGCRIGMDNHQS